MRDGGMPGKEILEKLIENSDTYQEYIQPRFWGAWRRRCGSVDVKLIIEHKFEFTKILLLSKTYRRPIGDLSETDMPDLRP